MASVQFVALLGFGLLVPCHSWGCLLQRNATHHAVEPCNEDHHRPALAFTTRQMHTLLANNVNAPAGHGGAAAAPSGHGGAQTESAPAAAGAPKSPHGKAAPKADLTAALRIELTMPLTIREIHEGPQGPLSHFLLILHQQLCKSANILPRRISLLGIRGEYTKLETMLLDSSTIDGKGEILLLDDKQDQGQEFDEENHPEAAPAAKDPHAAPAPSGVKLDAGKDPHAAPSPSGVKSDATIKTAESNKAPTSKATGGEDPALASPDHEVIVDMEILPGSKSSEDPAPEIFEKIKKTLEDPQSLLRTGPVGGMLANGELAYGRKPTGKDSEQQKAHEGHALGMPPNMLLLLFVAFQSYSLM